LLSIKVSVNDDNDKQTHSHWHIQRGTMMNAPAPLVSDEEDLPLQVPEGMKQQVSVFLLSKCRYIEWFQILLIDLNGRVDGNTLRLSV
jgi:hypothetical protein